MSVANNTILNPGVDGETFPSWTDSNDINWPAGLTAYAVTLSNTPSASVLQVVDATHGLPVSIIAGSAVIGHVIVDSGTLAATQSGVWNITNISGTISLPTGAATEATLSTLNGKVTACNTGAVVLAAGTAVIGHVVVDSSALPSGAATAANQSTEIASLASIDGKLPALVGGNVPITIAGQTGTVTVGGTVAVSNFPATQPVSGTVAVTQATAASLNATVVGTGTFAVQAAQSGTWNITNVSGTVSLPTGASTEATLTSLNGKVTACNTGAVVLAAGAAVIGHVIIDSGTVTFSNSTIAVTNTGTFAVQATLAAETTKVIGTVNQGTSPWVVSMTSTTITGTVAATQSGTWNVGTVTTLTQWNAGHGTAAAALRVELPTDGTGVVGLNAGANIIGKVGIDQTTPGTTNLVAAGQNGTWTVQPGNTPNTTPWLANELDPAATTGTISAADVATTSTVNNNGQTVITGAPTASSSVSATLNAHSGVTIQLTGTSVTSFAFAFERSVDGGTTYVPFSVELVGVGTSSATWTLTDNNAAVFRGNSGELTTVRVRCTAKTGTSVAVKIQPGYGVSQVIANQGPPNSNSNAWPINSTAQTTGGHSVSSFLSTAAVQATNVKASAGQIYSIEFFNINATPVYVRLYDKASAPGTGDTPIWRGIVPGNTAGSGFVKSWPQGIPCTLGVGFRCTAGIADNDNTALAASSVIGNVEYK